MTRTKQGNGKKAKIKLNKKRVNPLAIVCHCHSLVSIPPPLELTLNIVLQLATRGPDTPVSLSTIGTLSCLASSPHRRPRKQNVNTPTSHGADSLLPVLSSVSHRWLSSLEVTSGSWPTGLTDPESNIVGTSVSLP